MFSISKRVGGGLPAYIGDQYNVTDMPDWSVSNLNVEIMWLKLSLKDTRPTYIANVYRPPDGDVAEFISIMEEHINRINILGISDTVVMGDINIDLLSTSAHSRKLSSFLYNSLLKQLIGSATRVTNTGKTLLDHFYVSNDDFYTTQGTSDPGLSDHYLVYTARKRFKVKHKTTYFKGRIELPQF